MFTIDEQQSELNEFLWSLLDWAESALTATQMYHPQGD